MIGDNDALFEVALCFVLLILAAVIAVVFN